MPSRSSDPVGPGVCLCSFKVILFYGSPILPQATSWFPLMICVSLYIYTALLDVCTLYHALLCCESVLAFCSTCSQVGASLLGSSACCVAFSIYVHDYTVLMCIYCRSEIKESVKHGALLSTVSGGRRRWWRATPYSVYCWMYPMFVNYNFSISMLCSECSPKEETRSGSGPGGNPGKTSIRSMGTSAPVFCTSTS